MIKVTSAQVLASVDLLSEKIGENQKVCQVHLTVAISVHPAMWLCTNRPSRVGRRLVEGAHKPREVREPDRTIPIPIRINLKYKWR